MRQQKRRITILKKSNGKLHSKVYRLKLTSTNRKNDTETTINEDNNNLTNFLIRQQQKTRARGNRYTANEKMFALSLWHASPKCYRLLRSTFCLPSITTLRRSMHSIKLEPGFNPSVIDAIKKQVEHYTMKDRLVSIVFDEMSIKTFLEYNERVDYVLGYEDLGDCRNDSIANYVMVFMIRSITSNWKQPIGYFLTSGPMSCETICCKLREATKLLKEAGLMPTLVICDQGPGNRGCKSYLGVLPDQSLIIEGDILFFMFDPPHLLKSIRNGLYSHGFFYEGELVYFQIIRMLYQIKKHDKLEIAPKLTENHVELNSFAKMKVNLATQVLSQSVASAIRSIVILSKKLPADAIYTANFCEFFNNLFDVFNGSGNNDNDYKSAFSIPSKSEYFIRAAIPILERLIFYKFIYF